MSEQVNATNKIEKEEEVSLIDLFAVLLKRKKLIIGITILAMIIILFVSILSLRLPSDKSFLPNKYTPRAQMLINDNGSGNGLSSMLNSSGLGSLASLAGISSGGGGSSNSALAAYLVNSDSIQDEIVKKFNLIERYKIEKFPITSSREALKKVLKTDFDDKTGVFTVSFEDIDPVFACDVINYTVHLLELRFLELGIDKNKLSAKNLEENIETAYQNMLNLQKQSQHLEYSLSNPYGNNSDNSIVMDSSMLQIELKVQEEIYANLKAQYEALKVTMASEQPVFQILEYAQVPDRKSGPSRGKLCIIVTFAAFFFSIFLAFLLNAIDNIKADPEAMAKLHPNKKEVK